MTIGYINRTRIIFNERWKQFITASKPLFELNMYKALTEHLMTDLIEYYANIQENMRDYLKENNSKYDMTTKSRTLDMPEYYAFGISQLIDISDCNSFGDLTKKYIQRHQTGLLKIEIVGSGNHDIETEYEMDSTTTNCMCSHSMFCKTAYTLTDLQINKTLMLGCDCILKTGIINKKKKRLLEKQTKKINIERKNRINNSKLDTKIKTNILKKSKLKKTKTSIIELQRIKIAERDKIIEKQKREIMDLKLNIFPELMKKVYIRRFNRSLIGKFIYI